MLSWSRRRRRARGCEVREMNLGEWSEKILSMFREDGMTFGFAIMILDNTARKLKDEVIAQKDGIEK